MSGPSRREIMASGSLGLLAASALPLRAGMAQMASPGPMPDGATLGLVPDDSADQTDRLQAAIDRAATAGTGLILPPGRFRTGTLRLRGPIALAGSPGGTVLEATAPGRALLALEGEGIRLANIEVLGTGGEASGPDMAWALIDGRECRNLHLQQVTVRRSASGGIRLDGCSGRIEQCTIREIANVALLSLDAAGLSIVANDIADIGNNGVQVWRRVPGPDGTLIAQNRLSGIRAEAGGSGQNGNGINVFRAGDVMVAQNAISDCVFSAVRVNGAANVQVIGNSCQRLGEVALYAEFGFEGVIISNNLVDRAALGISLTNFDQGGRLAVCSGNLVRNLFIRQEGEPRGIGISVEADASVTGNVIEGAPVAGIMIGWGAYLRDVAVTGNVVRSSGVGIAASIHSGQGRIVISQNLLSGCADGAIVGHDYGRIVTPDLAAEGAGPVPEHLIISGNAS